MTAFAQEVHELRARATDPVSPLADRELALELGARLPVWSDRGLVTPVQADHLRARLPALEGGDPAKQPERDLCRREVISELWRIYTVFTSSDGVTRSWRDFRSALDTRRANKDLARRADKDGQ
jgi:hypothetical protein